MVDMLQCAVQGAVIPFNTIENDMHKSYLISLCLGSLIPPSLLLHLFPDSPKCNKTIAIPSLYDEGPGKGFVAGDVGVLWPEFPLCVWFHTRVASGLGEHHLVMIFILLTARVLSHISLPRK